MDTGFYAELQEPALLMPREKHKRPKAARREYRCRELGRTGL